MSLTMPNLLVQWYDAPHQRDLLQGNSTPEAVARGPFDRSLVGQMRWDAMRAPHRVQTYAQLLDGAIFHRLADSRTLDLIGGLYKQSARRYPFEVVTAGRGLESSLRQMAHRGFLFMSLPVSYPVRLAIQEALSSQYSYDEIENRLDAHGTADGVVSLLRDTGHISPDDCNHIGRSWHYWITAEHDGILTTREEQPYGDDTVYFAQEDFAHLPLQTVAGRAAAARVASPATLDPDTGTRRRSLAWRELTPLDESSDLIERQDGHRIRQSFNRCYYRAMAAAHGAVMSSEDSERLHGLRRKAAVRHHDPRRTVIFPHDYKAVLGCMSPSGWNDFQDSVRDELESWWTTWDVSAMQAIGDRIATMTKGEPHHTGPVRSVTALISAAGSAVSTYADSSATGLTLGGGVGLATWILTDPAVSLMNDWSNRAHARYDVVELRG
ncbi:hypothetical protein [Streptomyces sp. NBC_00728]|uniref:hypothetical protein n=1 Tax=Streptomyces sp. NBC_00728 TaxID=2903676 RepID=UPI003864B9DC